MFVQRLGPSGEPEWVVVDEEDEDDDGAVADVLRSSAYLDMLHDRPRAAAYARALNLVLEQKREEKEKERLCVLEVGVGSGLLSCLAARADNDVSVVACEQFPPMARLARRVLRDNGFEGDKVKVHCCRSEDLEVEGKKGATAAPEFLLPARADVVVSEILDSLLVGEGVLPVMRDASSRGLMKEDAVVIPSRGRVFVQAVRCRALGLASGGEEEGEEEGEQRCCKEGGSRCPVPLHLDPLFLSKQLAPLGEPAVLLDLDLARPSTVSTSTVEILPGSGGEDDDDRSPSSSSFSFDALAFWWDVDLAPGVSLSTAPCWAREKEGEEEEGGTWTDHWRSCWVPVPLCRRRRRSQKGDRFAVRGVVSDTEISVEVLPEEEESEFEEALEEAEQSNSSRPRCCCCCCCCSAPSLYSPSGDWRWGTARGSPAALLLEAGAKAAVARALIAASTEGEEEEDGAAIIVLGDGHGAAVAAAASASACRNHLRILALQPSRAGCLAVERFAGSSSSSSAAVEARLLSEFLSSSAFPPSSSPPPAAVALLAEPHYRIAEAGNLPWRLLDFWPRRDELVERGLLLPLPLSSPSQSPSPSSPLPSSFSSSKFSVTSPPRASVVVAAISCPLLSRNYRGELKEVEGVSMRLVDEAFRSGIGEEEEEEGEDGKKGGRKKRGARALFARALWQCGGAREVSARAELFKQQLDISSKRASEALPASDEVELLEVEEGESVHGVACWLRFEAAATTPTATTAADFWAPDPSGAPCPGSQAILLFHQPWKRGESKDKKLRVRVTLSLDEEGKKVDGEVAAF